MASLRLILLLVVIVSAAAGYQQPEAESCEAQGGYFINCLRLDLKERCCGLAEPRCMCLLKMETQISCVPNRRCSTDAKAVKLAEMNLSCMKNLRCKRP